MKEYYYHAGVPEATIQAGNIINWVKAGGIFALYLILLNVSLRILRKIPIKDKVCFAHILIITLSAAAAIAFTVYWCGLSLWLTLEAAALGFITYKTVTGNKMLFEYEE